MNKTETLYGRQEVANAWLDSNPTLANHVAERMHEELGKALADKICDGKLYRVMMEKPHIEIGDVGINQDCSVFRSRIDLAEVVMCQDCKYWVYNFNGCSRNPCTEPWYATDFCSYGERRSE